MHNILHIQTERGKYYEDILLVSQNIVVDLNNVMLMVL